MDSREQCVIIHFGASDARAACRELGYNSYLRYGSVSTLG